MTKRLLENRVDIMETIPCKDRQNEKPHVKCGCGFRKNEHCRFCGEIW